MSDNFSQSVLRKRKQQFQMLSIYVSNGTAIVLKKICHSSSVSLLKCYVLHCNRSFWCHSWCDSIAKLSLVWKITYGCPECFKDSVVIKTANIKTWWLGHHVDLWDCSERQKRTQWRGGEEKMRNGIGLWTCVTFVRMLLNTCIKVLMQKNNRQQPHSPSYIQALTDTNTLTYPHRCK